MTRLIKVIIVFVIAFAIYGLVKDGCKKELYTTDDIEFGEKAIKELEELIKHGKVPDVDDDTLAQFRDDISIIKTPAAREGFAESNTNYWPNYYYSFPYNHKHGGAWPPGMYSKLHNWSPGYYTGTGWSYHMRPGMGYKSWPRNRWIRNTKNGSNTYYYVTNRGDYTHNAANYADTPAY